MKNAEFIMWERIFEDCHTQCIWGNGMYTVTVKFEDMVKSISFDVTEKPIFGHMSSKDREASTVLVRKILSELKEQLKK